MRTTDISREWQSAYRQFVVILPCSCDKPWTKNFHPDFLSGSTSEEPLQDELTKKNQGKYLLQHFPPVVISTLKS